jgi:FkbM family methyltransferase
VNYKSILANNFLSHQIFIRLLPHMPRTIIQEFMGFESLSPIEQFASQGYNNRLYSELKIEKNETVLILGGYLGASISEWRSLFDCEVVAFEPIPEYAQKLRLDFITDEKVLIQEFAVSGQEGFIDLGIEGEATGRYSNSQTKLRVHSKDISKVINQIGDSLKLIEMNIEGGEYENLERLILAGSISKVPTLLVQFHRYTLHEELRRAQIRIELEKTHFCVFEFPWVWERWDVRY